MKSFTTPFTCSICKTEFCNPISLVKHVELEHPTALELSTINITRTEHKTYSGLLIESIIVSEFKDSNTLPIISENRLDKSLIDIVVIKKYVVVQFCGVDAWARKKRQSQSLEFT